MEEENCSSSNNSESIASFCAVTGAEPKVAEQYLTVSDGQIDNAVSLYLENNGAALFSNSNSRETTGLESRGSLNSFNLNDNYEREDDETDSPSLVSNSNNGLNEVQESDEELAQRLQNELYGNSSSNNNNNSSNNDEDNVREVIRPVTETLVDPTYDAFRRRRRRRVGNPELFPHQLGALPNRSGSLHSYLNTRNRSINAFSQTSPDDVEIIDAESNESLDTEGDMDDNHHINPNIDSSVYSNDVIDGSLSMSRNDSEMGSSSNSRARWNPLLPNNHVNSTSINSRNQPGASKRSRLAHLFRPPFDIMQDLYLDEAKKIGAEKKKWIMVNLQNPTNFQSQVLNRDFWSKPEIKETVRENFIFLQYNSDSDTGMQYAQYYPVLQFPHIAILDPRTGERLKTWSSIPEPHEWISEVHEFLERFSLNPKSKNPLAKIPKRKKDINAMSEEEQLKLAMAQSLGDESLSDNNVYNDDYLSDDINSSKSKGKQKEIIDSDYVTISSSDENDDDEVKENSAKNSEIKSNNSNMSLATPGKESSGMEMDNEDDRRSISEDLEDTAKEDIFHYIEPQSIIEPPQNSENTTRLQFRLGDGTRIVRRFTKDTQIKSLYAFLKADVDFLKGKLFQLTFNRRNLIEIINETLIEAGLLNSVVLVETIE